MDEAVDESMSTHQVTWARLRLTGRQGHDVLSVACLAVVSCLKGTHFETMHSSSRKSCITLPTGASDEKKRITGLRNRGREAGLLRTRDGISQNIIHQRLLAISILDCGRRYR